MLDKETVIQGFRFILGREPESEQVIENHQALETIDSLRTALISSREFRLQYKTIARVNRIINERPRIVFLHIPKTAGSSFKALAARIYGLNYHYFDVENWDNALCASFPIIGGHKGILDYINLNFDKIFIAVIREPVERAISLFNYYADDKDGQLEKRVSQGFRPDDFLGTIENTNFADDFINNLQCRYICGTEKFCDIKETIGKDKFVIGTYNNVNDWLAYLAEKLKWKYAKLPTMNVASNKRYLEQYYSDQNLINKLKLGNIEDSKLHEYINRHRVFTNIDDDSIFEKFIT